MFKRISLFIATIIFLLSLSLTAESQQIEEIPYKLIDAESLITEAELENKPELYKKAEEKAKDYIKENPYSIGEHKIRAYVTLAESYVGQNKIDLAKETYEEALDLEPQHYFMYTEVIHFYFKHDFLDEAESLAKECIKKFPDEDLRFKEYLLYVYVRRNEIDKAEELLDSNEELTKTYFAKEFKKLKEILGFLTGSKELEIAGSAHDKLTFIMKKIMSNPEKYSYLKDKIEPYYDVDFLEEDIEELKKIDKELQDIIDEIEQH